MDNHTCHSALVSFSSFYRIYVHVYLCFLICIVGSVFNIINIIVFTQKNMASSTNVVLTWLAVADLAVLLSYIPTTMFEGSSPCMCFSYWIEKVYQLASFISLWMTTVLAFWRYLAVFHPWRSRHWCTMKNTYRTVVAVYVLCSLVDLVNAIVKINMSLEFQAAFRKYIGIWSHHLIPAIALPVFTFGQVYALWKRKQGRRKLRTSFVHQNAKDLDTENQMNRTTRMLLIVLFLFLIVTMPYVVYDIMVISHLTEDYGVTPNSNCFVILLPLCRTLFLLDAASNFLVYYFMSCQFRETCHILFNCNTYAATRNVLRIKASDEITGEKTPGQPSSMETNCCIVLS